MNGLPINAEREERAIRVQMQESAKRNDLPGPPLAAQACLVSGCPRLVKGDLKTTVNLHVCNRRAGDRALYGTLDEIRRCDRVLEPVEIASLADTCSP